MGERRGTRQIDGAPGEAGRRDSDVEALQTTLTEAHDGTGERGAGEVDDAVGELRVLEADLARAEGGITEVHTGASETRGIERDPTAAEDDPVEADGAAAELGEPEMDAAPVGEFDLVEDHLVAIVADEERLDEDDVAAGEAGTAEVRLGGIVKICGFADSVTTGGRAGGPRSRV
ncbi:hypothetical protein ACIGFK_03630 [Streptomyces sp. NPDC085524]|uniref:hypothetical protein n=1 Tax=Streptomyces sp. NPDC085524 TaxID=3365728 RepID=UPI0037D8A90A